MNKKNETLQKYGIVVMPKKKFEIIMYKKKSII